MKIMDPVLPTVQSILCRADAIGSRFQNVMRQSPREDDAGKSAAGEASKSVTASQRVFAREFALVVQKVQVLKEISLKCDLNRSFSAAKNRESRKLEKQIRTLRQSIMLKDLPYLRKIANGQRWLFSSKSSIPQDDLGHRIDMIVQLRAWLDEKAEPNANEDSDDEFSLPDQVDITVDASNVEAAATPSRIPTRSAASAAREEASEATRTHAVRQQQQQSPASEVEADCSISHWQEVQKTNYAYSESEAGSWAVPEDEALHETFDEANPTAQVLHLQQMRRIAAQRERREAMRRRQELRNSKGGSVDFGKSGSLGSFSQQLPGDAEYPDAPPSEASTAAEAGEAEKAAGGASSEAEGSNHSPQPAAVAARAKTATPPAKAAAQFEYAGSDYGSPASTSRGAASGFQAEEPQGGWGGSARSEAYSDATPHQTPREVQQRIEEMIAAEAAQREEALANARMESQRMRDVLKKKSEAKMQRQAAMWNDGSAVAPEVKECVEKLQGLKDNPKGFVDMIYAHYPPKDGRTKYDRGNIKKTIQRAISHYHPDKQDEDMHGAAWVGVCDEICKELTRIYVKL